MKSYTIKPQAGATGLKPMSADMFGINVMISKNEIGPGGIDKAVAATGTQLVRYPGGTITEQVFDVRNPDQPILPGRYPHKDLMPVNEDFLEFSRFMDWAGKDGLEVVFVLPTYALIQRDGPHAGELDAGEVKATLDFVRQLTDPAGPWAGVSIRALEIGNEYWGSGDMSASQYGQVVNALAAPMEAILKANGQEGTAILAQAGETWGTSVPDAPAGMGHGEKLELAAGNIISEIEAPSRAAIDGLVRHHYEPGDGSWGKAGYARIKDMWAKAGVDVPYAITEWNINSAQDISQEVMGLKSAGVFLDAQQHLVEAGATLATAWPGQLASPFTLTDKADGGILRPTGAVLAMTSDTLAGARLLDSGIPELGDLNVNAWRLENGGTALYVASRVEERARVTLDPAHLTRGGEISHVEILGIDPATADGVDWRKNFQTGQQEKVAVDPWEDRGAVAVIRTVDLAGLVDANGVLSIELDPFEVAEIVWKAPAALPEDPPAPVPPAPSPDGDDHVDDDDDDGKDDEDDAQQSDGSGGGCFVVTAAYGDRRHPHVVAMRAFRDEVLVRHAAGRTLVRAYWIIGPVLARRVSRDGLTGQFLRAAVSRFLSR